MEMPRCKRRRTDSPGTEFPLMKPSSEAARPRRFAVWLRLARPWWSSDSTGETPRCGCSIPSRPESSAGRYPFSPTRLRTDSWNPSARVRASRAPLCMSRSTSESERALKALRTGANPVMMASATTSLNLA